MHLNIVSQLKEVDNKLSAETWNANHKKAGGGGGKKPIIDLEAMATWSAAVC